MKDCVCTPDMIAKEGRCRTCPQLGRTVPDLLRAGAATYEERNKTYGDNYKLSGPTMAILFPKGLPPMTPEQWNRFGVWFMIFTKAQRYAMGFQTGHCHNDTAKDIKVYGAMLEELTPDV